MGWLSEESALLVENWDTVEDILRARRRLRGELSKLLVSVESELSQNGWWQDGWRFIQYRENQVYISREDWRLNRTFLVWIGVERFVPEGLFGTASPPQLYVWIARKQRNLAQALAEAIEEGEDEPLGEVDHSQTAYVVKHPVQKCAPGEVEGFDDVVRQQIAEFFAHYAQVLSGFDGMIQKRIARLKEKSPAAGS